MKLKRIAAAMAAGVMAASVMSVGASAQTWNYDLQYMYYGQNNQTSDSKTITITSINQSITVSSFYRTNNNGYVHVSNPMHPNLDIISTTTNSFGPYTISVYALGTKATMEAELHNYYGSTVFASGSVTG